MFRFGDEISIPLFVLEDRPLEKFFKTTQDIIQVSTFHNESWKKKKLEETSEVCSKIKILRQHFIPQIIFERGHMPVLLQYFAISQQHISFNSISLRIFENIQRLEGLEYKMDSMPLRSWETFWKCSTLLDINFWLKQFGNRTSYKVRFMYIEKFE